MLNNIVKFYPEGHKYIDNLGRVYVSVTQLLKRMFPFNEQLILDKITKDPKSIYYNRNKDEILEEWKKTGDIGTALHEQCETYINTGNISENILYKKPVKLFSEIFEDRKCCISEKLLWDEKFLIAGTADLLVETDGCYEIWDIKTNKKMDNKKILQYSMQLTLYQMFAKNFYDKPIKLGGIIHFDNFVKNKQNTLVNIIKPVKCLEEVGTLLKDRLKEIKNE